MTTILVATNPHDSDSFLVQEALARKGYGADLVHTSRFPQELRQKIACLPEARAHDRTQWAISSPELQWKNEVPDVVWWRRPVKPVLPDWIHPEDKQFAALECEFFHQSFWETISQMGSFWINPLHNARLSENKILQQRIAIECGLETPATLYSNDPEEVRHFIRTTGGQAVYKPFRPFYANWPSHTGSRMYLYTSIVDEHHLPDDEVLALTPGIFQQLVPKSFELRVVVMGQRVFAFRIDTPEQSRGRLDWRSAYHEIRLEKVELEKSIEDSLLGVLRGLGLVAGSCDLIVTPSGRTVFLEVNEGGQFIWIEKHTGFPLLDAFCEFLIQHREDFNWDAAEAHLRVTDVGEGAELRWRRAQESSFGSAAELKADDPCSMCSTF